jgi:AcrR family transcriptional regulator
MRQIAQTAGIALGGIYNHFDSKEEIFLAVLHDHHPYYEVLPAMNAAQGDTVEDYVRDAANRMVGTLEKRQDFLNVMFIELVEFKGQHILFLFDIVFPQLMEFGGRFWRIGIDYARYRYQSWCEPSSAYFSRMSSQIS